MMDWKNFNKGPGLFLIIYQSLLILALPFYFYYDMPGWKMVLATFILLYLTGLSITVGYHRFYSHRSYRAHPVMEMLLLLFGAMAGQGSVLRWAFEHRLHHAHVDTDKDPYSIKKGFWYAHFLWILEKPQPIDPKVVPDLMKNRMVQFQDKYIGQLMIVTNGLAFLFVGWLLNDYVGAFFLSLWTRMLLLHHFTWFINSLAHTWGDKPFCQEQSAVNNYIIALLTFGEGYHNFHHTFANDYRNGIRWYQFDPSKWIIWISSKIGLTSSLKRMDPLTIKKRMILERKQLLLEKVCDLWYIKKDELEHKVMELSEQILHKISETSQLMEQYRQARQIGNERERIKEVKLKLQELKRSLKQDWRRWIYLSRNILRLKPLRA